MTVDSKEIGPLFAENIVKKLDLNRDGVVTIDQWVKEGLKTPAVMTLLGLDNRYLRMKN